MPIEINILDKLDIEYISRTHALEKRLAEVMNDFEDSCVTKNLPFKFFAVSCINGLSNILGQAIYTMKKAKSPHLSQEDLDALIDEISSQMKRLVRNLEEREKCQ